MPEGSVVPATDMYPSLRELVDAYNATPLSPDLVNEINYRYNKHGAEYATFQRTADGRIINACMSKDSVKDAREELTDAIFNMLVENLKEKTGNWRSSWQTRAALPYVIRAWEILSRSRVSGISS